MENRRVKRKRRKPYQFLCNLSKLDFENTTSKVINYCVIESSQEDMGLAKHEVQQRLNEINKQIDQNYICGVVGIFKDKADMKLVTQTVEEITLNYVKKNIKEYG